MTQKEICREIRRILDKKPEVQLCLLFGSASGNKTGIDSDIDIAIGGGKPFSPQYLADLQLAFTDQFGVDVDLLDLSRLNGLILREVITNGTKVVNKKPDLLAQYVKKMLFYNEDMFPNYRMMLKSKVKRFAHGL